MIPFRGLNQKVLEQMFIKGLNEYIDKADAKEVATKILTYLCNEDSGRVQKIEAILLPLVGVEGVQHLEKMLGRCRK